MNFHLRRLLACLALAFVLASLTCFEAHAAEITVHKAQRTLLYRGDGISRTFRIALGSSPVGRKTSQGDRRTPEGVYFIAHKNPHSQFHVSLAISYPNADDAKAGLNAHRLSRKQYEAIEAAIRQHVLPPQNTALGGDIFIHGRGSKSDWTWGCVALDDGDMDFLFQHARVGDRVTILP